MSQDAVERLLGRLLTDDAFRQRALRNLADATRQEGYRLTEEELRALTTEDLLRLNAVAEGVDGRIKRFCRT